MMIVWLGRKTKKSITIINHFDLIILYAALPIAISSSPQAQFTAPPHSFTHDVPPRDPINTYFMCYYHDSKPGGKLMGI